MGAIWAKTVDAAECDSLTTFQTELSIIALQFVSAAREHAELVLECGYLGYLLGVLPFVAEAAYPAIVDTVQWCAHACADLSALTRFLDIAQFVSFLSLPDPQLFVATCRLLEGLVRRESAFVAMLLEGGFPDQMREVAERTFREKAALISVLAAVMVSDVADSELGLLCSEGAIEMCREVYQMDSGAIDGLGGALARFHAITFEVPELHALVEDLIEG
jgi:hypothetical protein